MVYCQWLSQKTGLKFDLPTEAQWEKAARGTGGLIYPWGNDFDQNKCNSSEGRLNKTVPVDTFPLGKSPYGCMDMSGNVWEWSYDRYDKDYYKNSPKMNPLGPTSSYILERVLRGGSWVSDAFSCRAACRRCNPHASRVAEYTTARAGLVGFRLMMII